MKIFDNTLWRVCSYLAILVFMTGILSACGVKNANVEPGDAANKALFAGKTIAILPVHADGAITTDSQFQIKQYINQNLYKQFRERLSNTTIIPASKTIGILNEHNKLDILGKLTKQYKNLGVLNIVIVREIFKMIPCDYLVFSMLSSENVDAVLVALSSMSLDVVVVDKNNATIWSGTGDMKYGGVFGAGRVTPKWGAEEIVNLAFAYWDGPDSTQDN